MSSSKNTILNYFKRKSDVGDSSSSSPKLSSPVANKILKDKATNNGSPANYGASGDRKITPKNKKIPPPKEFSSILSSSSAKKQKRKRVLFLDDSEDDEGVENNEVTTSKKKPKITLSDLEDYDDDDRDPTFSPKKAKISESESESSEMEEEEVEDELDIEPAESESTESEPEEKTTPKRKIEGMTPLKSCLNVSFSTKQKLSAFLPEGDEKSGSEDRTSGGKTTFNFPHLSYSFLKTENLKDAQGRKVNDPNYDPKTLYVPESFLKSLTPAQKQWWEIKSTNFDKVLFFKMGKFYELFHMDAVTAVEHCELSFMKKDYAHCGFPEVAFQRFADILIDKNYKVVRIEQTETPDMMEKRCKLTGRNSKFDRVVKREVCQVSSIGTRISADNDIGVGSDYQYLLSLIIRDNKVGICFIDTTVGRFKIGQYEEEDQDVATTQLNISHLDPVEILLDSSSAESTSLVPILKTKFPKIRRQILKYGSEFLNAEKTLELMKERKYYSELADWPETLKNMVHFENEDCIKSKEEWSLGLSAFGGVLWYLSEAMIDHNLMTTSKFDVFTHLNDESDIGASDEGRDKFMVLDDTTIYNLDVLSRNKKSKSLFSILNHTSTPFGKRTLKKWICMPLLRPSDIGARQEALQEIYGFGTEMINDIKKTMKKFPDLERLVGVVASNGVPVPESHPESRAIYFDGGVHSKRKIKNFVTCLQGFIAAEKLIRKVRKSVDYKSTILRNTLDRNNGFDEMPKVLDYFSKAFNADEALKTGRIIPARGVDPEYDRVIQESDSLNADSNEYLKKQKKIFGTQDIKYVGSGKNAFQVEIPESNCKNAGASYVLSSQRKGFKRFVTEETKNFVSRKTSNEEAESKVLNGVSSKLFSQFSNHSRIWSKAINCLSIFDCLISLSHYSFSSIDGTFPKFIKDETVIKFTEGVHPIISLIGSTTFIPNDVKLDDKLMILTGANMGGKSTLMRQTALLAILAQVGCKVPAEYMELTPVDRIFTRIGATDNIFGGESTFMVELSETAKIMKHVTNKSLVIMDELGRGTTTYDGMAIAASVVNHVADTKCRTLFSTHFHQLTRDYEDDSRIQVYHMAYDEKKKGQLTFLYKLRRGACPKSHGFNTAKLAGLDQNVIRLGEEFSFDYERKETLKKNFVELLRND